MMERENREPEARVVAVDNWLLSRGLPAALATSAVLAMTAYIACMVVAGVLP